jgi:hypothetical protein
MADTKVVKTVEHTMGAESATSGPETKDVPREIVHENADTKAPSAVQKATEAVAQSVQKVKDAVVGKADHSAPPAPGAVAPHQSHV